MALPEGAPGGKGDGMRRRLAWVLVAFLGAIPGACSRSDESGRTLRVATTTSVEHSGLLAHLLPTFTGQTGIAVQVLVVGTGQALKLAEHGDVDAVLVHDPEAEEAFVASGHGLARRPLMRNDFILVGPPGDPAGIRGGRDVARALRTIREAEAPFVSRGDLSGTHQAEKRLWRAAGVEIPYPGYVEAGQGQLQALTIASERGAYALSDSATYAAARGRLALDLLVAGEPRLVNRYSGIAVNPDRHPGTHAVAAARFLDWLSSAEGQRLIGSLAVEGRPLFVPDAGAERP
jgi:tungstate transport system substrate-binding protein